MARHKDVDQRGRPFDRKARIAIARDLLGLIEKQAEQASTMIVGDTMTIVGSKSYLGRPVGYVHYDPSGNPVDAYVSRGLGGENGDRYDEISIRLQRGRWFSRDDGSFCYQDPTPGVPREINTPRAEECVRRYIAEINQQTTIPSK